MKLTVSSLCRGLFVTAFSIVTLTAVSAADVFEGRVHMQVSSGKKKDSMAIDYAIKEGKLRYDMPQQEGSSRRGGGMGGVIMDFQHKEMIILMEHDGEKSFMRRAMPQAKAQKQGEQPMSAPVATGRTEMIAGYKAAEYTYSGKKGENYEIWLAKGLGTFMFPASQGGPMGGSSAPSPEWEKIARDGNSFPLRVIGRDAKGTEISRMEVTKIEKVSLPDSLFSTDGYTEFKMPDMGGFMNMGGKPDAEEKPATGPKTDAEKKSDVGKMLDLFKRR